eukprot:SAG31_NODE_17199_length_679_cov_1.191379_1_plen_25_part_10
MTDSLGDAGAGNRAAVRVAIGLQQT